MQRIRYISVVWAGWLLCAGCEISPWAAGPHEPKPTAESGRNSKGKSSGARNAAPAGRSAKAAARPRKGGLDMRGKDLKDSRDATPSALGTYPAAVKRGNTAQNIPWIGGAQAKVKVEVFSDFGCPFCTIGARTIHKLLRIYKDKIKVLFYQVPIVQLHPDSMLAAQASLAAQAQGKFWQMHDMLYAHRNAQSRADLIRYAAKLGLDVKRFTRELDSGKYKKRIQKQLDLASKRKVKGTPTYFVDGQMVEGAAPLATFKKLIDAALQ